MPTAPRGWGRVAWVGPGLLWMVSAAGSGELLFTPRVGALYRYDLVWAVTVAVTLKWFVNREIGRFAVCTGQDVLAGFGTLRHGSWLLWAIVIPQVVVAVATIAGLGGSAGTALVLALPAGVEVWALASVIVAAAIVVWGGYRTVERVAGVIAVALGAASVAAAASVGPDLKAFSAGLVPGAPEAVDHADVVPWLGFMLSGAAGMMWYSYWIVAKGYGRAGDAADGPARSLSDPDVARLRGWVRQMTIDNTVAVVGTVVITLAFLVLGAELLAPEGLVPAEDAIAEVLGRLLGDVWGRAGFWFMVVAVFVGFWDTILSDQDGFGRMFTTAVSRRRGAHRGRPDSGSPATRRWIVVGLLTAAPICLYLVVGDPVALLALAGVVEAGHIPLVAVATLRMNRQLPEGLRPSPVAVAGTIAAAVFFAAFTVFYVTTLW